MATVVCDWCSGDTSRAHFRWICVCKGWRRSDGDNICRAPRRLESLPLSLVHADRLSVR